MPLQIHTAERKKVKLRIGITAPSGGGKTYSALLLAYGMTNDWSKIALIDTENGSGELYPHFGAYSVVPLEPPFAPERYIEAICLCEDAGAEIIIIDSATHEWDGQGGCLEIVDQLGGKFQDWAKVSPRHRKFIDTILQSPAHIITTTRRKQDYDMVKDNSGRVKVEKVGMKEVQREGFEYELTLNFDLDIRHNAKASKDRTFHGVLYEYEQGTGRIEALRFRLKVGEQDVHFSLPVHWRKFQRVLQLQDVRRWDDEDYVYRVAWRDIRDWVLAQLALHETEIVEMPQVFLPFATDAQGETIYEKVVSKQFLLGDGKQGEGV